MTPFELPLIATENEGTELEPRVDVGEKWR